MYIEKFPMRYVTLGTLAALSTLGCVNAANAVDALAQPGSPFWNAAAASDAQNLPAFQNALVGDRTNPADENNLHGFLWVKFGNLWFNAGTFKVFIDFVDKEIENIKAALEELQRPAND